MKVKPKRAVPTSDKERDVGDGVETEKDLELQKRMGELAGDGEVPDPGKEKDAAPKRDSKSSI